MKRLLLRLAAATVIGSGPGLAGELAWPSRASLESHLGSSDRTIIPAAVLLADGHALCSAGSYAFSLPAGYENAERELEHAALLPVEEGSGLLFSVDDSGRLGDVSVLSVWRGRVMLEAAGTRCLPVGSASLEVRRDGRSIVVTLAGAR